MSSFLDFLDDAKNEEFDPLSDDLGAYMGGRSSGLDDDGFNLDFLYRDSDSSKDLFDSDTSIVDYILGGVTDDDYRVGGISTDYEDFVNDEMFGLIAGADDDKDSFLERILGSTLSGVVNRGGNVDSGGGNLLGLLGSLGLSSFLKDRGVFDPKRPNVGYQGKIPEYTAIREQVTGRDDTDRRPGSAGRRYFSDTMYAKKPEGQQPMSVEEARAKAKAQASGFAYGGRVLEDGGYLQGDSDGQADLVPGDIDGVQEARLSHGEYVLPADLVAILGNGNSNAGAEVLDEFMSKVREKATGSSKQQKNIDADEVLQILMKV